MMIKTKALVIKEYTVGESDKYVTLFSKEYGKIQVMAPRAKKNDKGLAAATQLFVYGEFICSSYKETYRLINVDIIEMFHELRNQFESICYASYIMEFLDYVVQPMQAHIELLQLALVTLQAFCKAALSYSLIGSVFKLRALKEMGYMPQLLRCVLCDTLLEEDETASYYFSCESGGLVCKMCLKSYESDIHIIDYGTRYTMQYLLTIPIKKLYYFKITHQIEYQLSKIVQSYTAYYINHDFKSLTLLNVKSICNDHNS